MRIQEHLFYGYFGSKKKEDSSKHYSKMIDKLKGMDTDLDKGIEAFQTILKNHSKKIAAYNEFVAKYDKPALQALRKEITKLEGMFDEDELANENEHKYIVKIIDSLNEMIKTEDNSELQNLEKEVLGDLKLLAVVLENMGPLWEAQLRFIELTDEQILSNKNNIKLISDILKEESDILKMEEDLLRKADLKSGIILRKTTLKMRDIENTKDMDMRYRSIKHIR